MYKEAARSVETEAIKKNEALSSPENLFKTVSLSLLFHGEIMDYFGPKC